MESGGTKPYFDKTGWVGRALEGAGIKGLSISTYATNFKRW